MRAISSCLTLNLPTNLSVVYIAMATERLVVDSETLVLPVCVNRSGAERLAQPLPFRIQVTNIQGNLQSGSAIFSTVCFVI